MHIYNWYYSITTSILSYTRDDIDCMYITIPLAPLVRPSPLTWNPPCCDRIRSPLSWVARKLTPHFPHLPHVAPHLKSRPPRVFQINNIHSGNYYYAYIQLVSFNHYRHSFIYTNTDYNIHGAFPLLFFSPC